MVYFCVHTRELIMVGSSITERLGLIRKGIWVITNVVLRQWYIMYLNGLEGIMFCLVRLCTYLRDCVYECTCKMFFLLGSSLVSAYVTLLCPLPIGLRAGLMSLNIGLGCIMSWSQYASVSSSVVSMPVVTVYALNLSLSLATDSGTYLFLTMLTTVSSTILLYSMWYTSSDPTGPRLMSLLVFFTLSMEILMVGNDLLTVFLAWELIGIASFLLIGYSSGRSQALLSSLKATLYNRVGDICLLAGTALLLSIMGDTDFGMLGTLHSRTASEVLLAISMFVIVAAWSKSAQLGLHAWLLDAMEGPTPVSSLLHSATLVTAGVVLLLKTYDLWSACESCPTVLTTLGILTAFAAAVTALFYWDSKRVVAYSTCTHISLMIGSVSIGSAMAAAEHLYGHGWSKAAIFMIAGVLIHNSHRQDIRSFMPSLRVSPLLGALLLVGVLTIQGMPGTMISESKDWIVSTCGLSVDIASIGILMVGIIWASQGYSLGVFVYGMCEQSMWVPRMMSSMPLLIACPLMVLAFNATFLPWLGGDTLQSCRAGMVDLAELMNFTLIEPVGAMIILGLLTGTYHGDGVRVMNASTVDSMGSSRVSESSAMSCTHGLIGESVTSGGYSRSNDYTLLWCHGSPLFRYKDTGLENSGIVAHLPVSMGEVISGLFNRLYFDKMWNSLIFYTSVWVSRCLQGQIEMGLLFVVTSPLAALRQPMVAWTCTRIVSSVHIVLPCMLVVLCILATG